MGKNFPVNATAFRQDRPCFVYMCYRAIERRRPYQGAVILFKQIHQDTLNENLQNRRLEKIKNIVFKFWSKFISNFVKTYYMVLVVTYQQNYLSSATV